MRPFRTSLIFGASQDGARAAAVGWCPDRTHSPAGLGPRIPASPESRDGGVGGTWGSTRRTPHGVS